VPPNAMLRRQPEIARQIIRKLVDGPIRFTPKRDEQGRGYFEFEAPSQRKVPLNVLGATIRAP